MLNKHMQGMKDNLQQFLFLFIYFSTEIKDQTGLTLVDWSIHC